MKRHCAAPPPLRLSPLVADSQHTCTEPRFRPQPTSSSALTQPQSDNPLSPVTPRFDTTIRTLNRTTHLVILVLVILIIKVLIIKLLVILKVAVVPERFTGKVVDRARNDLFLELFAELVVELEALVELFELFRVEFGVFENLGCGRFGGREKVEKGLGVDGFANDAGAAGGCWSVCLRVWSA
jgi:hypothetical protein